MAISSVQKYEADYEFIKANAPHLLPGFVAPCALEDPDTRRSQIAAALKNINDMVSKLSAEQNEESPLLPSHHPREQERKQVGRKGAEAEVKAEEAADLIRKRKAESEAEEGAGTGCSSP